MDLLSFKNIFAVQILISYAYCFNITDMYSVDPNYGKTWMFIPDENGTPHIVDLETTNESNLKYDELNDNLDEKVSFWLYNKAYPTKARQLKATGQGNMEKFTLDESYDSNKPTKFIIHGWKNNLNNDIIQVIKDAYLKEPIDYNIIAVDWSEIAGDNYYLNSASATKDVGKNVAYVINHMVVNKKANLKDFHIIGHSLGAHTAGYAGYFVKSLLKKKVNRITGLDPAFPAFHDASKTEQTLDPSDAEFVDVIHTCSGLLGHNANLGHADFFPNGGKAMQPGCSVRQDIFGACSHGRSYRYFAESISKKNGFMSMECQSWDEYNSKKCNTNPIPMGDAIPRTARGTYFLETGKGPEFAKNTKIFV